jgi:hypothetical protein
MNQFARQNHPKEAQLASFMAGELRRSEASVVVRHLLTGCPSCVVVTRRLFQLGDLPRDLRFLAEEADDGAARCRLRLPVLESL